MNLEWYELAPETWRFLLYSNLLVGLYHYAAIHIITYYDWVNNEVEKVEKRKKEEEERKNNEEIWTKMMKAGNYQSVLYPPQEIVLYYDHDLDPVPYIRDTGFIFLYTLGLLTIPMGVLNFGWSLSTSMRVFTDKKVISYLVIPSIYCLPVLSLMLLWMLE